MTNRFTTEVITKTGPGNPLYSGESLALAIRAARGVKGVAPGFIQVIDHDKLDIDNNGEVPWQNFSDDSEYFAVDVEFYINHGEVYGEES